MQQAADVGSDSTKAAVLNLVKLHQSIKTMAGEMKKLRTAYKTAGQAVRKMLQRQDIKTVEADGQNVTVFEKKKPQSLNKLFVTDTLANFFQERKISGGNANSVANEAWEYLINRKKTSDRGLQWAITIRESKKKAKKRKASEGEADAQEKDEAAEADADTDEGLVPAPSVAKKPKVARVEF